MLRTRPRSPRLEQWPRHATQRKEKRKIERETTAPRHTTTTNIVSLSVFFSMYFVCMYLYIFVHVHEHVHLYVYVYVYVYVFVYVYAYVYIP